MRRATARNALRTLMPALVGPVRVRGVGDGDGAGVLACVVADALAVVAASVAIVDAVDFVAGDVVVRTIVEKDDGGEGGSEEEDMNEVVETGVVEDGDVSNNGNTSVVNADKVCTATGSEISLSMLRAERLHVRGGTASSERILKSDVLEPPPSME